MNLQDSLKFALTTFLKTQNDALLASIIDQHPELIVSSDGDYPDYHRIMDICVNGNNYRICRQISSNEELTLFVIDEMHQMPGVPLWLTGEKLKLWAKSEEEDPSDEETNWEEYR